MLAVTDSIPTEDVGTLVVEKSRTKGLVMNEKADVVVVLTRGRQDWGSRAVSTLAWACTSLASGRTVDVFLTMDGSVWNLDKVTGGIRVQGFGPLADALGRFLDLGGKLYA